MTDDELKALVARIAVSQDRTDEQLKALAARVDKIAAAQDRTDAQLARTDAKLDRLAEMYGGVSKDQGALAADFFFNALAANPVLGGERFDFVGRIGTRWRAGVEDHFHALLVNDGTVYIVEVKYEAHEKDLRWLLDVKAANFSYLFPEYADHEQHFALAAFHIHDDLKSTALEQGVTVLQRKGDLIESIAA